jgi:hypothetical protein
MMGTRNKQRGLFQADTMHLDFVGEDSLHAWLGFEMPRLFPDKSFSELYTLDNGRPSVPPSQLLTTLLLQGLHRVSDHEAIERSRFDLRWKVALQIGDHQAICAKSTLQEFRSKLLLHEKGREILEGSVRACREAGLLRSPKVTAAVDTTPIWGRGAVRDTYNLIADGIAKIVRVSASCLRSLGEECDVEALATKHDLARFFSASSVKGEADLDWDNRAQRGVFLAGLLGDAQRALALGRGVRKRLTEAKWTNALDHALSILERVITQDVELKEDGSPAIRRGVAKDRLVSVHDPDMRHGRKSKKNTFNGHKGEIVADIESGVILDAVVKPGNSADAEGSLEAVERAEQTLRSALGDEEATIENTLGDCAYGTANNRRDFVDAGRALDAKQPTLHNGGRYTKEDFTRDPETLELICPAGQRAQRRTRRQSWRDKKVTIGNYRFDPATCSACPLREHCLKPPKDSKDAKPLKPRGRSVSEHPEEALLEAARQQCTDAAFRARYRPRCRVEHKLARMIQLGGRQSRYFGRAKAQLGWILLASIANLVNAAGAAPFSRFPALLVQWLRDVGFVGEENQGISRRESAPRWSAPWELTQIQSAWPVFG